MSRQVDMPSSGFRNTSLCSVWLSRRFRLVDHSQELLRQQGFQKAFHFRQVQRAIALGSVGRLQSIEVGLSVVDDQVGNGRRSNDTATDFR